MVFMRDPIVAIVPKMAILVFRLLCYLHSFDSENIPKWFASCWTSPRTTSPGLEFASVRVAGQEIIPR